MIVCVCNNLTSDNIADCIAQHDIQHALDVYPRLQCRVKCGVCTSTIQQLIKDTEMDNEEEFSILQIEVPTEVHQLLITAYIERTLQPASVFTFKDDISNDIPLKDALYNAVINDIVIDVITKRVEEIKDGEENA
jgi:bacterioferritin-associated ferredoxin